MKKIAIAVIVLLFAGGGVGFFLLGGKSTTETAGEIPVATSAERVYVALDPITTTIFRDEQPAGSFTAAITLEVKADGDIATVNVARSRLRDAMFRELHAMLEREQYTGRKINVDAVKQRMLVVSKRELGEEIVLDLFVSAMLRKGA